MFGLAKSLPQIQKISDFDKQIDSGRLVWSGLAGEAACQGREKVGVLKSEKHSV